MKKAVLILILFTILAKIIGFGRDVILSYFYGASNISDAYLISLTIPTTIFVLLGMAVSMNYIPMYTQIEQNAGGGHANVFSSRMSGFLAVLSGVVASVVFISRGRLFHCLHRDSREKRLNWLFCLPVSVLPEFFFRECQRL